MYLRQAIIENNGPLKWLHLNLSFDDDGRPKPLILVGGNGSGKTNFVSLVADALFEAAAVHFDDVLPSQGVSRAWFRLVGGRTITTGTAGSFTLLRFDDDGTPRYYKEKAGLVDPVNATSRVPTEFSGQIDWQVEGAEKSFGIDDERSRIIFETGVYSYFPSSRSEIPYWLNTNAIKPPEFDLTPAIQKKLRKPIYIEQALNPFKQWLIGLLSDTRIELRRIPTDTGDQWGFVGDAQSALLSSPTLEFCNNLLQKIFADDDLRFLWLGRKSREKVAIARQNVLAFPNLDALSTGQAILLGMFGTLIRYGDLSQGGSQLNVAEIKGICIIDEIDAHIHVELQHKILPEIIKLFPGVQFIITSHSPIFVLGMEKSFGVTGIQVIDMPSGIPVGAETYSEFGSALEAMTATHAFTELVIAETGAQEKPIVYVEGETDAPYLRRAAELLGKSDLLTRCDIEWIGAKDPNGQGFHTGNAALKHTLSVLRANPNLAKRKVLLLYDNDSNASDQDYECVKVRTLPINPLNDVVTAGIENLLPKDVFEDKFYQEKETHKANGDVILTKGLRKNELCLAMCDHGTAEQFSGFLPALDLIEGYLAA